MTPENTSGRGAWAPHYNMRKNVGFAVIEFAVNVGVVFLSYRLVILQGGLEAVGLWATLSAWIALIRLGDAGMANALLRFVALRDIDTDAGGIRAYVETGIVATTVLFCALALVGHAVLLPFIPGLVGSAYAEQARTLLPWLLASFVMVSINGAVGGALQGLHLGFRRSQIAMVSAVLQLLAASWLVPRYGLVGLAIAQMAQYGLAATLAWLVIRARAGIPAWLPLRIDRAALAAMVGFSVKTQLTTITSGLFEPLSKLLLARFGGMQAQGLYELAFKTVWLSRNAIVAGLTATLPTVTNLAVREPLNARRAFDRANDVGLRAAAGLLGAIVLAAPIISMAWLGQLEPRYWLYVTALSAGALASAYGANAYNLAFAVGRFANNIAVNAMMLVVLAVAGWSGGVCVGADAVVASVALALILGGVAIRRINAGLLDRPPPTLVSVHG